MVVFHFLVHQLGMASALETLCGQAFGAKKYYMLGVYMQRSWIVLFVCCVLLLPLYLCASPFLKLLGQPPEVAELSGLVAMWLIPLHFSFAFQFPLQRFLQSQMKTGVIAWVSLLALVVHVIVSWLFVYKLKLGVVGTAATLNFSWWVLVFGLLAYTVCGGCPLTWTGFSVEAFSGLWEFVKLSVASGVMLWYLSLSLKTRHSMICLCNHMVFSFFLFACFAFFYFFFFTRSLVSSFWARVLSSCGRLGFRIEPHVHNVTGT